MMELSFKVSKVMTKRRTQILNLASLNLDAPVSKLTICSESNVSENSTKITIEALKKKTTILTKR